MEYSFKANLDKAILYPFRTPANKANPSNFGYCYLRLIPHHLHEWAKSELDFMPTNQEVLDFIDNLDLTEAITNDFYSQALVQVSVGSWAHITFGQTGLPPTELCNVLPMQMMLAGQYEWLSALISLSLCLPMLLPYIYWPSVYMIMGSLYWSALFIKRAPSDLLILAFVSYLAPVWFCPVLNIPANHSQRLYLACFTVTLRDLLLLAAKQIANIQPTFQLHLFTPSPATLSPHSSDREYLPTTPKCPNCARVFRDASHQKHHRCKVQISPSTQSEALLADLDLKVFLFSLVQTLNIPQNRHTVVVSFLQSAKAQVALAKFLGFVFPEEVSGNKLSLHGASTLLESSLHRDDVLLNQMQYYYRLEISHLASLEQIPSPLKHFTAPELLPLNKTLGKL